MLGLVRVGCVGGQYGERVEQQDKPIRIRGKERFRRASRLRLTRDFGRVRRRGRHVNGALLSLSYARHAEPAIPEAARPNARRGARVGLSVSKRVGTAVVRNVVKRRLREVMRRELSRLAPGWDIVITARADAASADYETLRTEVRQLLERARPLTIPAEEAERREGE